MKGDVTTRPSRATAQTLTPLVPWYHPDILEIVRLALVKPSSRGIGLLPFTLASILLILIVIHLPVHSTSSAIRPWMTSVLALCFWIPALIFTSIKLRVLGILMGPEPRTGSEYLDS